MANTLEHYMRLVELFNVGWNTAQLDNAFWIFLFLILVNLYL
jgi:hypothetical protein